jgi:hypothetical protein
VGQQDAAARPQDVPDALRATRCCVVCGRSLDGRRADTQVCGPVCRRERSRLRALLAGRGRILTDWRDRQWKSVATALNNTEDLVSPRKKFSSVTGEMEQAYHYLQRAAAIAHGDVLTDVENDYVRDRVAKMRYELKRIEDKLYRPESVRDVDEEFGKLLERREDDDR